MNLFTDVQNAVQLLTAPSNGRYRPLFRKNDELIFTSQKADWLSHKLLWFVVLMLFDSITLITDHWRSSQYLTNKSLNSTGVQIGEKGPKVKKGETKRTRQDFSPFLSFSNLHYFPSEEIS